VKVRTADEVKAAIDRAALRAERDIKVSVLVTKAKTYRLTERALNLLTLAVNEDRAHGVRTSLTGKVEDAIISSYAHLEDGSNR
jgi:translation initiation factor 2 alpha subunit (eIF-2alpha)